MRGSATTEVRYLKRRPGRESAGNQLPSTEVRPPAEEADAVDETQVPENPAAQAKAGVKALSPQLLARLSSHSRELLQSRGLLAHELGEATHNTLEPSAPAPTTMVSGPSQKRQRLLLTKQSQERPRSQGDKEDRRPCETSGRAELLAKKSKANWNVDETSQPRGSSGSSKTLARKRLLLV
mmetsp:Transcript_40554/g.75514  ORF Transcript_40554/g.75514 Transcript_40554/m.75514 type:complete len:181 (+) Transcript_40554:44-586(+)